MCKKIYRLLIFAESADVIGIVQQDGAFAEGSVEI